MNNYEPFAISNFRTGFDTAVEPWLLPRDAFQVLKNAHLYRGVVEKIDGYGIYARMTHRTEATPATQPVDGVNAVFSGFVPVPLASTDITIQATLDAIAGTVEKFVITSYDPVTGVGIFTSNLGSTGGVDFATGFFTVTFSTPPPSYGGQNAVLVTYDLAATQPIMGIHQYYSISGGRDILVFDTRRVGKVVALDPSLTTSNTGPNYVQEIAHEYYTSGVLTGDGATTAFSGNLGTTFIVPGSVSFVMYDANNVVVPGQTVVDNGANGLELAAVNIGGINYATGAWNIIYPVAPALNSYVDVTVQVYGDIFTGDFTNFFSLTNYKSKAFFVNDVDPPMYYDGVSVHYLNTNLAANQRITASSGAPQYDITRALHVQVYRNYLVLLAPTVDGIPQLNAAYWSAQQDPLDWTVNQGLPAPTSQSIKAFSIINSDMIVRFSNSEYVFRFIGDAFDPFRWDSTNVLWRCDAPYSAINYDSYFSSVGKPAIVASDGVNVQRVDEIIPDITLNSRIDGQQPVIAIDQTSIGQCYGLRFDDFKEGWLCYKGYNPDNTGQVLPSDSILAYNYIDKTYAVYTFPFSCLGFGTVFNEETWGTNNDEWDEANYTWDSFQQTKDASVGLAGDQFGAIYQLGEFTTTGVPTIDPPNPVLLDIVTKNFNPFIEQGVMCRLGYLDLFVSANSETKVRVQCYKDDQMDGDFDTYFQESVLTFTPTASTSSIAQIKVWKRIYIGAVGKEFTFRIYQSIDDFSNNNTNQPVKIHAMVLYCKPTGMIFQ